MSLLPDFCIPRRQHGPVFLAHFLNALIVMGLGLMAAYRALRKEEGTHSTAQGLLRGFASHGPKIQIYLARLQPRSQEAPDSVPPSRKRLGALFYGITQGIPDLTEAFLHHGYGFYQQYTLGLA